MTFFLYTVLSWVAIICWVRCSKALSLLNNIFLFCVFSMLTMNVITILGLNLGLLKVNTDYEAFLSLVLYRNFIIPLSFLFVVNKHVNAGSKTKRLWVICLGEGVLVLEDLLAQYMNVLTYIKWSTWYSLGTIFLYMVGGIYLASWFERVEKKEA